MLAGLVQLACAKFAQYGGLRITDPDPQQSRAGGRRHILFMAGNAGRAPIRAIQMHSELTPLLVEQQVLHSPASRF